MILYSDLASFSQLGRALLKPSQCHTALHSLFDEINYMWANPLCRSTGNIRTEFAKANEYKCSHAKVAFYTFGLLATGRIELNKRFKRRYSKKEKVAEEIAFAFADDFYQPCGRQVQDILKSCLYGTGTIHFVGYHLLSGIAAAGLPVDPVVHNDFKELINMDPEIERKIRNGFASIERMPKLSAMHQTKKNAPDDYGALNNLLRGMTL